MDAVKADAKLDLLFFNGKSGYAHRSGA